MKRTLQQSRKNGSLRACSLALFLLLSAQITFALPLTNSGLDAGYRAMYNLKFAEAHAQFSQWTSDHPSDPMGPVSDAAAYLFAEFDRLGVLDIELFSDDDRFSNRPPPSLDPVARKAFEDRIQQADQLADKRLATAPQDANALFVKTLVYGLQSDYASLLEKKYLAAFSLSKKAGEYAQHTLAANSNMFDAYVGTGVENYMLGLKPAPMRWVLNLTGAQTDKVEGIRQLRLTADQGHFLAPFARLLLAVAALRDKNKDEARKLLTALSTEFPGNSLYSRQLNRIH